MSEESDRRRRDAMLYDRLYGQYDTGKDFSSTTAEDKLMQRSIALVGSYSAPHRALQDKALANMQAPGDAVDAAIGAGRVDVQGALGRQPMPRNFGNITDQALTRAKALTRVSVAGDKAVKAQSLRDRIAASGFGLQRAGLAIGQGQIGVDLMTKRANAERAADATRGAAWSNLGGAILGGVAGSAGAIKNAWTMRGLGDIPVTTQRLPTGP